MENQDPQTQTTPRETKLGQISKYSQILLLVFGVSTLSIGVWLGTKLDVPQDLLSTEVFSDMENSQNKNSSDLFEFYPTEGTKHRQRNLMPNEHFEAVQLGVDLSELYNSNQELLDVEQYKSFAVGKLSWIAEKYEEQEKLLNESKKQYPDIDFFTRGVDETFLETRRNINQAINHYNNGNYMKADEFAFYAGVSVLKLDDSIDETIRNYEIRAQEIVNDLSWVRLAVSENDTDTHINIERIAHYLENKQYETAFRDYHEVRNSDKLFNTIAMARDISSTNSEIWGAMHWLLADLKAFDTENYDLLSDEISRNFDRTFTPAQVSHYSTLTQCYIIVSKYVYDITDLLKLEVLHPAIRELKFKCGTDVSNYIASQPVQSGSANTARFKWVLWWFERGTLNLES